MLTVLLTPNTYLFLQRQQASQAQALDVDPAHTLHTTRALVKASNGADHLLSMFHGRKPVKLVPWLPSSSLSLQGRQDQFSDKVFPPSILEKSPVLL